MTQDQKTFDQKIQSHREKIKSLKYQPKGLGTQSMGAGFEEFLKDHKISIPVDGHVMDWAGFFYQYAYARLKSSRDDQKVLYTPDFENLERLKERLKKQAREQGKKHSIFLNEYALGQGYQSWPNFLEYCYVLLPMHTDSPWKQTLIGKRNRDSFKPFKSDETLDEFDYLIPQEWVVLQLHKNMTVEGIHAKALGMVASLLKPNDPAAEKEFSNLRPFDDQGEPNHKNCEALLEYLKEKQIQGDGRIDEAISIAADSYAPEVTTLSCFEAQVHVFFPNNSREKPSCYWYWTATPEPVNEATELLAGFSDTGEIDGECGLDQTLEHQERVFRILSSPASMFYAFRSSLKWCLSEMAMVSAHWSNEKLYFDAAELNFISDSQREVDDNFGREGLTETQKYKALADYVSTQMAPVFGGSYWKNECYVLNVLLYELQKQSCLHYPPIDPASMKKSGVDLRRAIYQTSLHFFKYRGKQQEGQLKSGH